MGELPAMPVGQFHELEHQAADLLQDRVPRLDTVRLTPAAHPGGDTPEGPMTVAV